MKQVPVSVLMSTYAGETASNLGDALASVFAQTLPPRELVLVVDGPVGADQEAVLADYQGRAAEIALKLVRLETNQGLAAALNAGLAECTSAWVARMDSDDLCEPDRLAVQYELLRGAPEVDLVAAWHAEFNDDPAQVTYIKTVGERHEDIARQLKWRNVVSHPTIVFRKAAVLRVGGYRDVGYLEDYDLYVRLIRAGFRFHAVQRPLVKVRVNPGQRARRSGPRYALTEWRFRAECYRRGFLSFGEFLLSSALYAPFRMVPAALKSQMYRLVRVKPRHPNVP